MNLKRIPVLLVALVLTASVACNAPGGSSNPTILLANGCSENDGGPSGSCTTCSLGWGLTQVGLTIGQKPAPYGTCEPCPTNCDYCSDSAGLKLPGGYCASCSDHTALKQVGVTSGQVAIPYGTCEPCPTSCSECADGRGILLPDGYCSACDPLSNAELPTKMGLKRIGFTTGAGAVPYGTCEPCADENCDECSSDYSICTYCNDSHVAISGKCDACGEAIEHCSQCATCGCVRRYDACAESVKLTGCCVACEPGYYGEGTFYRDASDHVTIDYCPDSDISQCKIQGYVRCN